MVSTQLFSGVVTAGQSVLVIEKTPATDDPSYPTTDMFPVSNSVRHGADEKE